MKTYKNHRCDRRHKTPATFIRCAFPTLAWVQGTGEYAVIAWCGHPTITLWEGPTTAQHGLNELNAIACGSRCEHRHEIVRISIGATV